MTARLDTNGATGASGSPPRDEALDALRAAWNVVPDRPLSEAAPLAQMAQALATVYVGDELAALRAELRDGFEQDPTVLERYRQALAGPRTRAEDEEQVTP